MSRLNVGDLAILERGIFHSGDDGLPVIVIGGCRRREAVDHFGVKIDMDGYKVWLPSSGKEFMVSPDQLRRPGEEREETGARETENAYDWSGESE
ncbi:MAG: hypothetical protein U9Q71_05425 [Pseudomonadota bacterium]|nr:hypothetical protein [Pseudomonadota bacterium]